MKKLLYLFLFLFCACEQNSELIWQPQVVIPLAFGDLDINDQPDLNNVSFSTTLGVDFGFSGITIVPPINGISTAPENFRIEEPPIVELGVDSLILNATIQNRLGITINSGARVIVRNLDDQSELISHTISRDIPNLSTYTLTEVRLSGIAQSDLEILVENISSPGSSTPINLNNNSVDVDFSFNFRQINYIIYPPQESNEFVIRNDFDLDLGEDIDNITGRLFLITDNQVNFNFEIQAFFLDADENVIATLSPEAIQVNAGTPENPDIQTIEITDASTISSLLNVKEILLQANFNTNHVTENVRVEAEDRLNFRVTGDLNFQVQTN